MTAPIISGLTMQPFTKRQALYCAKFLREHPISNPGRGRLWIRVAEGRKQVWS